jgi:hypothetical protein
MMARAYIILSPLDQENNLTEDRTRRTKKFAAVMSPYLLVRMPIDQTLRPSTHEIGADLSSFVKCYED